MEGEGGSGGEGAEGGAGTGTSSEVRGERGRKTGEGPLLSSPHKGWG